MAVAAPELPQPEVEGAAGLATVRGFSGGCAAAGLSWLADSSGDSHPLSIPRARIQTSVGSLVSLTGLGTGRIEQTF